MTSDDLKVYLWSIEQPHKAFISVDLKPENLEELSEVITSSTFHPTLDNMFLYTTSKGIIKVCDMRRVIYSMYSKSPVSVIIPP